MPHMIISGMPGIGKTTSVLCLARQLLGDAYKEAVLELNASDERGRYHMSKHSTMANLDCYRYRCCTQSDQGLCPEESDSSPRAPKACDP